jgi:hypothetical protein
VPCADDPLPSGDWIPKISRTKGKYSTHQVQAVTKYLTNDPLSCSDSGNASNLLSFGALSHAIIPVGLPWR